MFLGEFSHTLDDKGRVVMPRKFRSGLEAGCVITKGQDHCLYVFPAARWDAEADKVLELPRTNLRARNFARSFFASATDQQLDKQGRVQIPEPLRAYASLEKDVSVIGVADRVEVWATDAWRQRSAEADEHYAEIEEVLSEGGI